MATNLPSFRFSRKAARTVPPPINYLMRMALERKGVISLAAGFVDDETLPVAELRDLTGRVLGEAPAGREALQYGTTIGLPALREALLEHLCRLDGVSGDDLALTADNVVVGSGSQQILYIVTDVLVDPGDIVITPWPSYFVYTGALVTLGASVRAVEMDEQGMRTDALAETLADLKRSGDLPRVKVVYVCDYYQNPTGITLSRVRREELLELVRSYSTQQRICVLEDAAYRELHCGAPPPPSIKSLDRANAQVVLAQTFSKPFAPGLRTGYAFLPDDLVGPVLDQKGSHDFGSSNFSQHLLWRAMTSGAYAAHVEALRRRYRQKRDAILEALRRHLGDFQPAETSWTRPGGGLYVYLTLPRWMDTGPEGPLFAAAMAEGVLYVPGEYCYGPDPRRQVERNHMRLTFGTVGVEEIAEGVARLGRAIRKVGGARAGAIGGGKGRTS